MRKFILSILACVLVTVLSACSSSSSPGASGSVKIDIALFHTENDAFAQVFKDWSAKVKEKTEGRVVFNPHYSASLVSLFDTLDSVSNGAVDAGILSAGAISGHIPAMGLVETFGVFKDEAAYKSIYQEATPLLSEILEKRKVKLLFWSPGGIDTLAFHRSKTLQAPDAFKDLKMRTAGRWQAEQVKLLGATPVTMDPSELYLALQNGTVDSTLQTVGLANAGKLVEVANKVTSLKIPLNTVQWVINPDVWAKISPEDQKIIMELSNEAGLNAYKAVETKEVTDLESIKSSGGEVYQVTDAERAALLDVLNQVNDKIVAEAGEEGQQLNEILKKYR
ncbi:hypothetical protein T458_10105 [Brevibacillus panacihumi W25]|uniref:C4-dicarboxylate ABC transporter substrate-binding protein n=1 Tax=Brevibacillus panacihumi W25 TaxID=1408254 RepID=V6MB46_9BACL|nr:TRAP transporter substrate-binding protein [Brevibacillus panacihumi]EST55080.1 hypothetical protein T458_10105 [Brevibacillus panacihumi W25]